MEATPKITVLIPTYNRAKFLPLAVDSIFRQTHKNIEVIIYDDGSTDDTSSIVLNWVAEGLPIRYIKNHINKGVSCARNILLSECKTEIACWQDSDDVSNIHRLEIQLNALSEHHIVYSSFANRTPNTNIEEKPNIIPDQFANASGMFYVNKAVQYDEGLLIGEDNNWRHRMSVDHKIKYIPQALYYILFHSDRLSVQYRNRKIRK